ncbi:MAG: MmgE/PrpD family protein, partial [Acidimicrobiia bacterium]|nr:MmgE/PrpD family protein [Acidimicrobiia bacterium]
MTTPGHQPTAVLNWLHDTTLADMPEDVVAFGQRCLLDLLGVAAAGRTTELSSIIHDHAAKHFGAGTGPAVPMLFDGREVSPAGAALASGMTIDSIDAHDGNNLTKGHTGCHQVAAILAFTQAEQKDDAGEFLASLIVGYEIATRAGIALHQTACDYHTSGAWGAVGAAALGARVLGLDHASTFEAMGIAEYHGPRSQMMRVIDHPTMLKDGSGWGAMAGVSAAYLAADGFTGAPAVTINDPTVADVWADLGERWIIFEQYFKPHPVCRWAQPAVEAALNLCREHNIPGPDVEGVEVVTFHEAARLATALPATTEQAQYSLPFPVAAAIVRGQLGATEVSAAALADEEIRSLSQRVTIVEDNAHNAAFPHNRYARVTINLADGTSHTSEDTEPRGDATAHLSDDEIRAKFHLFADPVLGRDRATVIGTTIGGLSATDSLTPFLELLRP